MIKVLSEYCLAFSWYDSKGSIQFAIKSLYIWIAAGYDLMLTIQLQNQIYLITI